MTTDEGGVGKTVGNRRHVGRPAGAGSAPHASSRAHPQSPDGFGVNAIHAIQAPALQKVHAPIDTSKLRSRTTPPSNKLDVYVNFISICAQNELICYYGSTK